MTDYQIEANTRRCSMTGRELRPGERFFTALFDEGGKFHRLDYSTEAWQSPPEGAFSFWAGKIPEADDRQRPRIDDEMLLECFHRLNGDEDPGRVNFCYVVALLLMRRKRFRFDEAVVEAGQEVLVVRCIRTRNQYRVVNPRLTEEEMNSVQDEVFKVLGWH